MRSTSSFTIVFALSATALLAQAPPIPPEHDLTTYGILFEKPEMSKVTVRRDLPFKTLPGGATMKMDLYLPAGAKPSTRLPAVVFVNGVGDAPEPGAPQLRTWGQYTSWARLMAAEGFVAVTHEATGPDTVPDIQALFAHLRADGATYGIDPKRL